MELIDIIKGMLYKRVLYTEPKTVIDLEKGIETVYSCKLFISNLSMVSRHIEPEIITITDEEIFDLNDNRRKIEDFNLVNIFGGALDEVRGKDERYSIMYLKNSSVDELRLPSLKTETCVLEQSSDIIIWKEKYPKQDNPDVADDVLEKLNSEERISRAYRKAGCVTIDYFGACLSAEPFRADTGAKPYYYKFTASELPINTVKKDGQ